MSITENGSVQISPQQAEAIRRLIAGHTAQCMTDAGLTEQQAEMCLDFYATLTPGD